MAVEQKHLWLVAVGVAVVVGITGFGVFRAVIGVKYDVAALNDKVDAASSALDGIKTANEALTKIQKSSSLDGVKSEIDAVKTKIESANAALGDIQKNSSLGEIKTALASLDAKVTQVDGAVAQMQKSAATQSSAVEHEQAHGDALMTIQADVAALKSRVDGDASSLTKIADAVAKLNVAAGPQSSAKPSTEDLVVVYVYTPDATATTGSVPAAAAVAPLAVHYERVGSINDDGEAAAVAKRAKALVKDRKGCAIAVTGHGDTLGDDDNNLELSRERANEVAMKLKAALKGQDIPISQTAWGARRLSVWTPDQTAKKANRRVDISANCKG